MIMFFDVRLCTRVGFRMLLILSSLGWLDVSLNTPFSGLFYYVLFVVISLLEKKRCGSECKKQMS